ncbi:MAG: hypothetical protein OIN90_02790, partial [Candidatus Methanoperedens sp.]|nr:hypothetical protein [Candidatus Methanoperedens sp.]
MDELMEKILKLQSDYFKRRQLLFILDLISIFAISYAIFIIISSESLLENSSFIPQIIPTKIIPPIIAFIIAIIGSLLLHKNDHKIKFEFLVEDKYPELKEKLRTAYDNINEQNVIVESLKSLVLSGLTIVSASSLLSTSVIITKIILVIIFISGATIISLNPDIRIPPDTIANNFKNLTGIGNEEANITIVDITGRPENSDAIGAKGAGDIFGKPKIASIEGKNIDLTLYSGVDTGFDVRDTSQTSNQFIRSAAFPVDVLGSNVSDGGYSMLMKKTETEKMLINKY